MRPQPHCWSRPDIPLDRLHVFGIEIRGKETPTSVPTPVDSFQSILEKCAIFQSEQLIGSSLSWSIHAPITLPFNILEGASNEAGEEGANLFYSVACEAIRASASPNGTFPEALRKSSSSDSSMSFDRLPSHITFCCFYRWGQDSVIGSNLQKYFVWNAAVSKSAALGTSVDSLLSDVSHAGGSRASFFGKVKVADFYSALASAGYLNSATNKVAVHSQLLSSIETPHSSATPYIGLGIGIITMEAWLHAYLPGCDAVAYHEAIGHGCNMPHPSSRQEFCVMSVAQYQGVDLVGESDSSKKVIICEEIKAGMYSLMDHFAPSENVIRSADSRFNPETVLTLMQSSSNVAWFWTDNDADSDGSFGDSSSSFTGLCRDDPIVNSSMCSICGSQSTPQVGSDIVGHPQRESITQDLSLTLPQDNLITLNISECESLNSARQIAISVTDTSVAERVISSISDACISKLVHAAQREKDGSAKKDREKNAALTAASSKMTRSGGQMKIPNESIIAIAGSRWGEMIFTKAAGKLTKREAYSFREVHFGDESAISTIIGQFCSKCISAKQPSRKGNTRDSILDAVSPLSLSSEPTLSNSAFIFLHDSSRGLSIALPLHGNTAFISSSGLKGPWHFFHNGVWSKR